MEAVDREADLLAQRYGTIVPGAALAETMRNLFAFHDRRISEIDACVTDLAAAVVQGREPPK